MPNIKARNNAQIALTGPYLPIETDSLEQVNETTWKGNILRQTKEASQSPGSEAFFSRHYDPEKNECDLMWKENAFSEDLLGIPFTLIPNDKVFFLYQPHSIIAIPTPGTIQTGRVQ